MVNLGPLGELIEYSSAARKGIKLNLVLISNYLSYHAQFNLFRTAVQRAIGGWVKPRIPGIDHSELML